MESFPPPLLSGPMSYFIAVDDLRVELGCYGNTHVRSPNIDNLASRGTLFQHAYCQQTVCNPSRASLMTGMRPDTLRVWDLPTHFRQNRPAAITLPQLFQRSGYHTQCIGKNFHNWRQDDWKGDPASWSVPSILHYNSHGNDHPQVVGQLPPNLASGERGIECRAVPDNAYYDGRVADNAINTMRELSRRAQPFFLAVGFWKPHTPFNAPKKYWDLYDRDQVPVPKHVTPPANVPDIALTSLRYAGDSSSTQLREMHHGHLAAISYLDAQAGRVLGELDRLGMRENTIVVFWSDHGLHIGEHGLTNKTTAFELDAHVPLIIAAPDYKPGQRTNGLVELLDVYPTLAELCDLETPREVEGVSLAAMLSDPNARVKAVALTQLSELAEQLNKTLATSAQPTDQEPDQETSRMLDLAKTGADATRIDFAELSRVPSQHAVISDVRDEASHQVHQHAYLAHHQGRYWAIWSDGPGVPVPNRSAEEHRNLVPSHDQPGTRVSYAYSEDGLKWSPPADLSGPPRIDGFGWIARGLWIRDGEMLALASHFNAPGYPGKGLSLEAFRWDENVGKWLAHGTVLDDTLNNFPPKKLPGGEYMMTRRDHLRQVSVMIGGQSAFNQWQTRPLASYHSQGRPEEPYWYVLPDGKTLVGLIRDNGRSGRLLRTFSHDNGRSWSRIAKTNFPDATSKFFVLRTSRKYYAMVSNANPRRRDPLTLSISSDGLVFTHLFELVGGRHVDYPHMIEHDDHLMIAFSGAKQTMEVLRVALDDLDEMMHSASNP